MDLHPVGAGFSTAFGVSGGQQVGYIKLVGEGAYRASLWTGTAGSWVDLGPSASDHSKCYDVHNGRQVGVFAGRASLWSGTAASIVDLHPIGADWSEAVSIHGNQQVGFATLTQTGTDHASLWGNTSQTWVDLNPPGADWSYVHAVFNGWQAGRAEFSGEFHAGVWTGTAGSWVDLHAFLPANFGGSEARGVWGDGQNIYVVGFGYSTQSDQTEALLWRRTDPDSFLLALNKSSVAGQNSVLGTITMIEIKPTNTIFTTYD